MRKSNLYRYISLVLAITLIGGSVNKPVLASPEGDQIECIDGAGLYDEVESAIEEAKDEVENVSMAPVIEEPADETENICMNPFTEGTAEEESYSFPYEEYLRSGEKIPMEDWLKLSRFGGDSSLPEIDIFPEASEEVINQGEELPEIYNPLLLSEEEQYLPPMRDQNPYGLCWAYATVGAAEIYLTKHKMADPKTIDLSEAQLAWNMQNSPKDKTGVSKDRNVAGIETEWEREIIFQTGGRSDIALELLITGAGLVSEEKFPKERIPDIVSGNRIPTEEEQADRDYVIKDTHIINTKSVSDMKAAITTYGSVTAAYGAWNGETGERHQYLYEPVRPKYSSYQHEVVIVGWDDTVPKEVFTNENGTPKRDGAWLARNSWQDGYPEGDFSTYDADGYTVVQYFWISYENDTECGCAVEVSRAEDACDYDYHLARGIGPSFLHSEWSTRNLEEYANVYKVSNVSKEQTIEEVCVGHKTSNVDYEIKIYTGLTDGYDISTGKLETTISGRTQDPGYITHKLDKPIVVCPGENIAIEFDIDDKTPETSICYEVNSGEIQIRQGEYIEYDKYSVYNTESYGWDENRGNYKIGFRANATTTTTQVLFNGNGATGGHVEKQYLSAGDKIHFPKCSYDRDGYKFLYWSFSEGDLASGDKKYYPGDVESVQVENGTYYTIYAHWEKLPDATPTPNPYDPYDPYYPYDPYPIITPIPEAPEPEIKESEFRDIVGEDKQALVKVLAEGGKTISVNDLKVEDVPKGLWVSGIEDTDYTGKAITFPNMKVFYNTRLLQSGRDYTVKYSNNTKASTPDKKAIIKITAKGNFGGSIEKEFNIRQLDIKNAFVSDITLLYKENSTKKQLGVPNVYYEFGDTMIELRNKKDYLLTYTDEREGAYISPSERDDGYQITITGTGNYCGQIQIKENIISDAVPVKTLSCTLKKAVYNAEQSKPEITIKYKGRILTGTEVSSLKEIDDLKKLGRPSEEEEDYYYILKNSLSTHEGIATIIGNADKGFFGTVSKRYKISSTKLSGAMVSIVASDLVYDGTQKIPEITVKEKDGTVVSEKDLEISYSNNINAGNATAYVKGLNGYSGTVKKTYKILPFELDESRIISNTVKAMEYEKGGVTPGVKVKDTLTDRILVKDKDYKVSYKNNTKFTRSSNPTDWASVTITGKGNYKGTLVKKFVINPRDLYKDIVALCPDVVARPGKSGICKPQITLLDLRNNKKLKQGTDYRPTGYYAYTDETIVQRAVKNGGFVTYDEVTKYPGDLVEPLDIIPAGTMIRTDNYALGNFSDSLFVYFRFIEASEDISKARVSVCDKVYEFGEDIQISKSDVTVTIKGDNLIEKTLDDDDYEIVSVANNTAKGNGTLIIKGKGKYGGIKQVRFKITAKNISE